jgi:3-oxoacyl-[acyl-carrier protein] reductase
MTRSIPTTDEISTLLSNSSAPLALVTGASGGVGRCCAKALADIGYATVIVGRSASKLRALADEINAGPRGTPCIALEADLLDREGIRLLLAQIEAIRAPDVFVSAAGITSNCTDRFDDEHLDEVIALNVLAPMYLTRGIIALMEIAKRGYIINIASRAGLVGFSDKGIYGASKAATLRFFDALYAKNLDTGIRLTSICPGWINTPMASVGGCQKRPEEILQPEDISSAVVWLVSSPSRVRIRELVVEAGGSAASA